MKFIDKNSELKSSFKDLITQYDNCCICVAWASLESEVIELLNKYSSKVKQMIVGLDFGQTDDKFIEHYLSKRAVRYFTAKHYGVFHPKMYLFYNDEKHWRAIVGSANLTYNGFSVNQEACMLVGDNDAGSKQTYQSMRDFIDRQWKLSTKLNADGLADYKVSRHKQQKAVKLASSGFKPWNPNKAIIDDMTWDEYITRVYKEEAKNKSAVETRIKLLNRCQNLFASVDKFNSLPYPDRACLAGYKGSFDVNPDDIDCFFFGSTTKSTGFKHSIKSEGKMSKAIDVIPLEGEITLSMYEDYCSYFDGNPLDSATRLLAVKRPDVFVCINSKNKDLLCNDFGIPKSRLNLKNYWDLIICRIQDSNWYNDNRKLKREERDIKKYQAAMLDSVYYRR